MGSMFPCQTQEVFIGCLVLGPPRVLKNGNAHIKHKCGMLIKYCVIRAVMTDRRAGSFSTSSLSSFK